MNVICCQLDIAWEDRQANYSKVNALLERVDIAAGDMIVLPEMFSTGFTMNVAAAVKVPPQSAEGFLRDTARRTGAFVLGGVVNTVTVNTGTDVLSPSVNSGTDVLSPSGEKLAVRNRGYNTSVPESLPESPEYRGMNQALAFNPDGKQVCGYTKMRLFTPAGESDYYDRGRDVEVFDWSGVKASPFICYDLRFPELFRLSAGRGAELFAVIANWPKCRHEHFLALLKARAIENQAYVVGVNRCGNDERHSYAGGSVIFDPHGNTLTQAGDDECTIISPIDPDSLRSYRRDFPTLNDMTESI